jgi:hypothetical protein
MKRSLLTVVLIAGLAPCAVAETGSITGVIDKAEKVTAINAIDRNNDKKFPAKIDAKTGKFIIDGLPFGTYDLLIDFGKARLEGVNLRVPRSDYEVEQPLSKDDEKSLKEKARELNQFEDEVDVLTIKGNIQHAAVVLNKRRTKPFYESKPGEIIWRLEVWRFEKPDETWIKVQDELFLVLYRERLQKTDYDKKSVTLDGTLGGLKVSKEKTTLDVGTIKLPAGEAGVRIR